MASEKGQNPLPPELDAIQDGLLKNLETSKYYVDELNPLHGRLAIPIPVNVTHILIEALKSSAMYTDSTDLASIIQFLGSNYDARAELRTKVGALLDHSATYLPVVEHYFSWENKEARKKMPSDVIGRAVDFICERSVGLRDETRKFFDYNSFVLEGLYDAVVMRT